MNAKKRNMYNVRGSVRKVQIVEYRWVGGWLNYDIEGLEKTDLTLRLAALKCILHLKVHQ